jgi:4'-phosphopantetheinyl transferase
MEMMPTPSQLWPPVAASELQADRDAVWSACLDQPPSVREKLLCLLSSNEKTRADRFCFVRDREHFIVRHGILRTILGCYLGVEPGRLGFCYPMNKPALMGWCGGSEIHFNLSHSAGLGLFAFVRGCEVGIDIEYVREIPEMDDIAVRFFSEREKVAFDALPWVLKRAAFFNWWTRKEAFVKALGMGLSWPLQDFDVSLTPGEPARILEIRGHQEQLTWSLLELRPAPGYAAAVAVPDRSWQIECRRWSSGRDTLPWPYETTNV